MAKQALQLAQYNTVRDRIKAGDIIAFSGRGFPSDQIKRVTHSVVSHVGIVLQSKLLLNGRPQAGVLNQIIEAVSNNGFNGVQIGRLSDRIAHHNGEVWWLPLDSARRKRGDWARGYNFLLKQDHKRYDREPVFQFLLSRLPKVGRYFVARSDYRRFFCSELAVAGLIAAGVIPGTTNSSDIEPQELCELGIYRKQYVQIKGDSPVEIRDYNTRQVAGGPTAEEKEAVTDDDPIGLVTYPVA